MQYDVIVVGAGASGLLAAGIAAQKGAAVLLLERNQRVGRKLLITGKGRCNLTNNCDLETLLEAVRRNPRFLYSAFHAFSPQQVISFFEELGVPLKTERGRRVFPISDKAMDVVDALNRFVKKQGVTVQQCRVSRLLVGEDGLRGVEGVDGKSYLASTVILATGGLSYPLTGSTGDGYALAKGVGHTVSPPLPTLVPIALREKFCPDLMGLSLKNVTLSVYRGEKLLFSELGELMFTHFGISGPLVLSASAAMDGNMQHFRLLVDLKPGLSLEQLDARILRDFDAQKNKAFKSALDRLLPRSLCPIVIAAVGISPATPIHTITREQRAALGALLKGFPLTPKSLRPIEEAVVTRGGVVVTEVNPKTMESRLCRGLYFAGELLDLDAVTGGFNLQIAFSTGFLAGSSAAAQIGGM